jgi:hypothetical protein
MPSKTTAAKGAGPITISRTGNVDFAGHTPTDPALSLPRGNVAEVNHVADKFVTGRAAKTVVAVQDLDVGVANAREAHANERPARAQPGQSFRNRS